MRKFILLLAMVIIMAIGSVDSTNRGNQCREAGGNCVVLRRASPACKKYREVNDCRGTRKCCPEKSSIVGKDTNEEDSEKRPMKERKKLGRKAQRPGTRQRCGTTDACTEKGGKCKKRCRKNSDPSLCDNNCVCCGICQAKPKCDSFEGVCRRSCSATERVIKGGCKKKKKCTCCAKQCEQNDCLGTCVSKRRECNGIFVKNGCGGKQCHCCNPVEEPSTPAPTPAPTPEPTANPGTEEPSTQAPGSGCIAPGTNYNYDEVLHKSLLFYEAQRSGDLPDSQRVTWRKDSALGDAKDSVTNVQLDLTGGYYDAGDRVKFGHPMSSMTTVLAWGAIDYGTAYIQAGEMSYMKEAVKWATDYFIKAHVSPTVLYGQVGDGQLDHEFWGRPEDMTMERPAYKITEQNPGSDLVGETSAALTAASILFRDSNPAYADDCLRHARELYSFADNFRGLYNDTIPGVSEFYPSSGYDDELAWAAAWLYRATGENSYLTAAKTHYQQLSTYSWGFTWAEKTPGVQVLLAQLSDEGDKATYVNHLTDFCNDIIDNRQRTPKGLMFLDDWGSLRYAANAAFICLRAADLGINAEKYREFGKQQIHYILGDTGRSYVVGFGVNPPQRPHHASSSCKLAPEPCGWTDFHLPDPNPHILYGALVGGPDINDWYEDKRDDYKKNEVTIYYNAGFQSAVAALRYLADCGSKH